MGIVIVYLTFIIWGYLGQPFVKLMGWRGWANLKKFEKRSQSDHERIIAILATLSPHLKAQNEPCNPQNKKPCRQLQKYRKTWTWKKSCTRYMYLKYCRSARLAFSGSSGKASLAPLSMATTCCLSLSAIAIYFPHLSFHCTFLHLQSL
jgi:hypothetical protein